MNDNQTNQNNENSPLGQVPQQANQPVELQATAPQPAPAQEFAPQTNDPQMANLQQTMAPQPSQVPPVNNESVIATPVVPQPKKSMNKGLLFGMIGGAVAIIAVALILIFVVFAKPSMSDYAEARTKLSSIANSYSKIDRVSYSSFYDSTETTIKNDLDTLKTSRKEISEGIKSLGNLRAVQGDADIKEAYGRLKEKMPKYEEFMDMTQEMYENFGSIMIALSDLNLNFYSSEESIIPKIKAFREKLERVEFKNEYNKAMLTAMISSYKEMEEIMAKLESMKDSRDYNALNKLYDQINDAEKKAGRVIDDWQSNYRKLASEADIEKELDLISDFVFKAELK